MAEWRAELFYVSRICREEVGRTRKQKTAVSFCLGAFPDAFWMWRNTPRFGRRQLICWSSACGCLLSLALLAATALMLVLLLPGARRAMTLLPDPTAQNIVTISRGGYIHTPTVFAAEYAGWKQRRQSLFPELAAYSPIQQTASGRTATHVAIASEGLFHLLGLAISETALNQAKTRHLAIALLSANAARRYYGDTNPTGKIFEESGRQAVIAGVMPPSLRLPGDMDAWLLADQLAFTKVDPDAPVFVLGRTDPTRIDTQGIWRLSVPSSDGYEGYDCVPLSIGMQIPLRMFLSAVLLACLALPATTPLSLGDYPARIGSVWRPTRLRRWSFLTAKLALLLPIVYCCALCLAYARPAFRANSSEYIQLVTCFLGCLLGFRWALRDQRQRCPVCLALLTNPVRVGQPSRSFLCWNGTELMCASGHGLLHVPELATSWFSTQRWLNLDSSWGGLFPEACLPPAPGAS